MLTKNPESAAVSKGFGFHKFIAVLLIVICIFTSCRNGKKPNDDSMGTTQPQELTAKSLKAPYAASDSLNPYYCTTNLNSSLMSLAFRGLFSLKEDLDVQPELAVSYTEEENGIRVILPTDGEFSDGSHISSTDVVYSFQKAKAAPAYSGGLQSISTAEAISPMEVLFECSLRFPSAASLLTFPIVKEDTADTADSIPIGDGLFVLSQTKDGASFLPRGRVGQTESIQLVPVTDTGKLMYLLQTKEIDFFCSELYGERISKSGAKMMNFPENTLIFLGVNLTDELAQNQPIRHAISLAVNRSEIAESVYSGFALSSVLPFRPKSRILSGISGYFDGVDYTEAERILEEEGYKKNGSAVRSSAMGSLRFSLLVCEESGYKMETATCIQDSLASVGIQMEIRAVDYETYLNELEAGNFDFYLGEVKLPANGSLQPFFGGEASFGIPETAASYLAYHKMEQGSVPLSSFLEVFYGELPLIPLVFRNQVLVCSDKFSLPESAGSFVDIFHDISQWSYVIEEESTKES